jgi:AcrR family transcriptional regulator
MAITKKRTYNSESRKAQAQKKKDHILSTAKKLFESKGFEKVTIEEIAREADVSAPTIYALFQSKSGVLRAVMDNALSPELHQALVTRGTKEKTVLKRIATAAIIARQLYDAETAQLGSLQNASILSPEFKKLEMEREERRYERQRETFEAMVKEHKLVKGLNVSKARDILWAFTGRDLYRMLVLERGWSSDEYERWLAHLLADTLFEYE